jgi:hypothetical protein
LLVGTSALALSASLPGEILPASGPGAARKIKRGVTFYSYQEEYYKHEVSVEDCFAEVASMGATGVQFIAEEMVPNYRNPPQSWVDNWQVTIWERAAGKKVVHEIARGEHF